MDESQFASFRPWCGLPALPTAKTIRQKNTRWWDVYDAIDLELGHLYRLMRKHRENSLLDDHQDLKERG